MGASRLSVHGPRVTGTPYGSPPGSLSPLLGPHKVVQSSNRVWESIPVDFTRVAGGLSLSFSFSLFYFSSFLPSFLSFFFLPPYIFPTFLVCAYTYVYTNLKAEPFDLDPPIETPLANLGNRFHENYAPCRFCFLRRPVNSLLTAVGYRFEEAIRPWFPRILPRSRINGTYI